MTVYTIIAYKESYYYDRYSDFYQSEWNQHFFEDREEAILCILNYKIRVQQAIIDRQGGNEDQWEYKLLIDGRDDIFEVDELIDEQRHWKIELEARNRFEEWKSKADEREEAKRLADLAKKEEEDKRLQSAHIEQEKRMLKKLQEKYPNG